MSTLNEPQARAVEHARGPLLIFAGAGSGKTRTITYRVANLLATHRVPPYRILAVTFTNKAAGEMRARLEQLAGAELARDLWVGTFHAVCARILRRHHDEVGLSQRFVIYDESDQRAVMARLLKARGYDERRYPPKWVLSRILAEKREGRGPSELAENEPIPDLGLIYEQYQRAMITADAVDFEDLIVHLMRIVEDPDSPGGQLLRARFSYVLVDEFQDTNITQYRLVRALSSVHRNLCVVGDDDQSIYSWRGADVRIIRGFEQDFPDATVIKLEQNYRSTGNIVAAALGVIEPARERAPKSLWTAADAGEPVVVRGVMDEREEATFVVRTAQAEIARGVSPREIAVFYRVHAQSRVLEEAFRARNVPYQIVGGMKFFERAEVKDLLAYLRLIENPKSDADLMRVINVPARGIGSKTLEVLQASAQGRGSSLYEALPPLLADPACPAPVKKKLAVFWELMEKLRRLSLELLPHELTTRVIEQSGYLETLESEDSAESDARLGNLRELAGSVADYEAERHALGEPPTLSGYLERITLVSPTDAAKDTPSVSLMTVHSAKGLEFHTVLLTGMEEEVFPYRGVENDSFEELEEERRLAYVAITRARHRLFITHAGSRSLFGQLRYLAPSRFLGELPRSAVVEQGARATLRAPPIAAPRFEIGTRVVDREAFDDLDPAETAAVPSPPPAPKRPRTGTPRHVRPGDPVYHRRFGRGTVEQVEPGSGSVLALFPGFGMRRILKQYLEFPG